MTGGTRDCAHLRHELGAYALGALEPAEQAAIAAHLEGCRECAAEAERLAVLPGLLARADGLEVPPPSAAIEERILDRVAHGRRRLLRPRRNGRLRALVATGLAGAVAGAAATALVVRADDGAAPAPAYDLALTGSGGASARVALEPWDGGEGTEVHLWVKGLPPGSEAVYEVRCERPGWSASAGTFRADAQGHAYVVLTTAARIGEYERIRIVRGDENVLTGSIRS